MSLPRRAGHIPPGHTPLWVLGVLLTCSLVTTSCFKKTPVVFLGRTPSCFCDDGRGLPQAWSTSIEASLFVFIWQAVSLAFEMMGLGNGRRTMKSPPLVLAALVACIIVLGFNYWIASSRSVDLQVFSLLVLFGCRRVLNVAGWWGPGGLLFITT